MFDAKIRKVNKTTRPQVNKFLNFELRTLNFQFSTFNFLLGVRQSRRAFRYIFARALAKDAASIPNALEAAGLRQLVFEPVTEPVEVPNFYLRQTQTPYTQSLLSSLTADG